MIAKFSDWCLQNSKTIIILFLVLAIFGVLAALQLPIDAVPDITPTQIIVNTKTGALEPQQIEKTITYYIESEMAGIPGIDSVRSLSRFGLSQVILTFEEGIDIYWARQLVLERIQNIKENLPAGVNPEMGPISTGLGEIVLFRIFAKKGSPLSLKPEKERLLYLRTITDYLVRPYIKSHLKKIADVDILGGYKKQIHIDLIPDRLLQYGLSVNDVIKKLETIGENFGGGYIQRDGKQILVRTSSKIGSLKHLKQLPIHLNLYGQPIVLKDLAYVREDSLERVGFATYRGQESVFATIFLLLGENSREVSLNANEVIQEIPLPADTDIEVIYNRSELVNATIKTVIKNLAEGALLVVLILFFVVGNLRASFLVSLAIPLCMLYTLFVMKGLDISANLISLGAIDFGLLVDGSIVVIENVLRKMQQVDESLNFQQRLTLISESLREVASPVSYGLLIVMGVYIPILALQGIEGKMFRPMAMSVLIALGFSLLVAMILMPSLSLLFLGQKKKSKGAKEKESLFFRFLKKGFQPVLMFCLRFKLFVLLLAIAFAIFSFFIYSRMGSDFIPPLDEGDISLGIVRDAEISLDESMRQQKIVEKQILKTPEVITTFARSGTAESATDPMGVNMSDTYVILNKDRSTWRQIDGQRITKIQIYEEIKKNILSLNLPEQELGYTQPIELRFNEILEGSRADISLRIYGKSLDILYDYQEKARDVIQNIPGTISVELDGITALRKNNFLDIDLDYRKINLYGLDIHDVNTAVQFTMQGIELGSFYEYDWRFPIVMRLAEEYRNDPRHIAQIPVSLPDGGNLPLSRITDIQSTRKVANIARSGSRRYAAVAINLKDRDIVSYVQEAKQKIQKELPLPEGYQFYWGGQFKNLQRARARLAIIIPITLLGVFLFIYKTFGNFRQTIMVYLAIPFAMTGGILVLNLRGMNLNISASIGFIALMGIGVLDSMVLVSFFNDLRKSGMDLTQAVREGTMIRLRPVITTSIVAGLGFLPMALNTGMGSEVQKPLATVIIGGLVTSTSLTLLLLPLLYESIESRFGKKNTNLD